MDVESIWPTEAEPVASDFNVSLPVIVVVSTPVVTTFKAARGFIFTFPVPVIVAVAPVFTVKSFVAVNVSVVSVKEADAPENASDFVLTLPVPEIVASAAALIESVLLIVRGMVVNVSVAAVPVPNVAEPAVMLPEPVIVAVELALTVNAFETDRVPGEVIVRIPALTAPKVTERATAPAIDIVGAVVKVTTPMLTESFTVGTTLALQLVVVAHVPDAPVQLFGRAVIVIVKVDEGVPVPALPPLGVSVSVTVVVAAIAVVAGPEMTPVVGASVRPGGNVPLVTAMVPVLPRPVSVVGVMEIAVP
jgi:hypothetical protein